MIKEYTCLIKTLYELGFKRNKRSITEQNGSQGSTRKYQEGRLTSDAEHRWSYAIKRNRCQGFSVRGIDNKGIVYSWKYFCNAKTAKLSKTLVKMSIDGPFYCSPTPKIVPEN